VRLQKQRDVALTFRNADRPFIIENVNNIEELRKKWTFSYLSQQMDSERKVERSKSNHFM
jgi:hypothetical protein